MKSKSFRYLWLGQSLANLGDILYIVGLISLLYSVSESAIILAMLPFLNTFGRFVSGMFAPILFGKYKLKSLLVSSQLSKTIVLLGLALWLLIDAEPSLLIIYSFILIIALLDGWAMPATGSMLPRLVEKHEILQANSFVSVVLDTIQIAGWAVGGILVSLISGYNVIWLTFGLFVLSTWMMFQLQDPTPKKKEEVESTTLDLLKVGWVTIWKNKLYRSVHIQITIDTIANVVWIAAILYVFVFEVLQGSESWWGYINTVFFIGLLIGGIVCSIYAKQVEGQLRKMMIISSFAVAIVTFFFGANSLLLVALILTGLHGFVQQVKGLTIDTFLQKEAEPEELPMIYSAQNALISLVFSLASLGFGLIAEVYSVKLVFYLSGTLLLIGALFISFQRKYFPKGY